MNREIKFRAWDTVLKSMVPSFDNWIDFDGNYWTTPDVTHDTPNTEIVRGHNYILMQFTGLHDKNGKEIYEGDVFKKPVKINQSLHGDWAIYEFLLKNGLTIVSYIRSEKDTGIPRGYLASPYFDEFDVDTKTIMFATQVTLNDCEIIGNIYQNPELIKLKEQLKWE